MDNAESLVVSIFAGSHPQERCGVGIFANRLSEELRASCLKVEVVSTSRREECLSSPQYPYPDAIVASRRIFVRSTSIFNLVQIIKAPSARLLHIHYPAKGYGRTIGIILLPLFFRLFRKGKVILTLHEFQRSHPLRKAASIVLIMFSGAVICPAEADWRRLKRLFPAKPMASVPLAPQFRPEVYSAYRDGKMVETEEEIVSRLKPREGEKFLLTFGYLRKDKDIMMLLGSIENLRAKGISCRLVIVGDTAGAEQRVLRWARERELEKVVTFWGYASEEEIAALVRKSDLIVLPFKDGFDGNRSSLISLLPFGKPVVTTSTNPGCSIPSVSPSDGEELSRLLDKLLAKEDERQRVAAKGQEALKTFSWERIVREHREIYNRVLTG